MSDAAKILKGITVLDRGQGMPIALIAKFLAELGADVIRDVDPAAEPFAAIYPADAVWRSHERRVKPSAQRKIKDDELLANADICLLGGEDLPGVPRSGDARALSEAFPRLIALEITAYPEGYGDPNHPAVDILVQATSGLAGEHFADRPVMIAYKPTLYGAALLGLSGVFAALIEREASGRGQAVFTSLFEGTLPWCSLLWFDVEKPTPWTDLVVPRGVRPLIFRCRDGNYIHMAFFTPGARGATYKILEIDDPEGAKASGFPQAGGDPGKFFGDIDRIAAHVARFDSAELLEALRAAGVGADLVLPPGSCWNEPQVIENGLVVHGEGGSGHVSNPLDLHISKGARSPSQLSEKTPLEKAVVLDLGTFVAGPFSSVLLSDLGAEVIKVESISGDPARINFRSDASANRGKKNIKIDLKSPKGLEVLQRLCAKANLVMNNFRVGASKRLGVDPQSLQTRFPGLAVVECTAYGLAGPRALEPGFDMMIQAWSGHEARAGGSGNTPAWSRSTMVDYGTGLVGSIASLACLFHQVRTGEGVSVTTSLLAGGLYLLSEMIRGTDGKFEGAPPLNASQTGIHPAESFYQVKDGWIAVAARDAESGGRLAKALGLAAQFTLPFSKWGDAEQGMFRSAFSVMSRSDSLQLLKAHDVWAEAWTGGHEETLLKAKVLQEKGTIRRAPYPNVGNVAQVGTLVRFSRSETCGQGHAPLPGEHTREILGGLGYSGAEIEALYVEKIVA